jgi:GT2 family glycosyltransferase
MEYSNISIVISSHLSKDENNKFESHLRKTIGLKNPEILIYENFNQYSLTEIYNIGLNESKNDIVLFIHNDIYFNTNNWGKILLNKFNTSDHGILGIAGTTDINQNGVWWGDSSKMIGSVFHKHENKTFESKYSNLYNKEIIDAIVVDGLFIAVNKNKIQKSFVEEFKGFHYYDISFCLENVLEGVKIGVIFDIKVTHNSIGMTNEEFENNRKQFIEKYKDIIPLNLKVDTIKDVSFKNHIIKNEPLVSGIIPHKNNNQLLFKLLNSIKEKTSYSNYKIYIADTGSDFDKLNELKDFIANNDKITLIEYDYYNFAKINNDVVKNFIDTNTELILFLNNDIEFVNDVISIMVNTYLKNKNLGTVGARLYYQDNTIQHSGISLYNKKNKIYLTHYGIKSYYKYYKDTIINTAGNTAACMLTPYNIFLNNGMFNEDYIECFEDVEYNLKCILNNRINIFAGNAVAYHYESQTRNLNTEKNKRADIDHVKITKFISDNYQKLSKYIKIIK